MVRYLKVPIGPNMSVDGGPFAAFQADPTDGRTDPDTGVIYGEDQNGVSIGLTVDELQDGLRDEMRTAEHVNLSTGDVDEPVGTIRLPLLDGYYVGVEDPQDQYAVTHGDLGNLRGNPISRRKFERRLKRHGGYIEG